MFDMNQCKLGDKLLCRDGRVVTYSGIACHTTYPHKVTHSNGGEGTRTNDGSYILIAEHSADIIGFASDQPRYGVEVETTSQIVTKTVWKIPDEDVANILRENFHIPREAIMSGYTTNTGHVVTFTLDETKPRREASDLPEVTATPPN